MPSDGGAEVDAVSAVEAPSLTEEDVSVTVIFMLATLDADAVAPLR